MFGARPLFHAFGIPVTIDPLFLLGMFLLYTASGGGRPGLFTVIGIAIYTLIHELGHGLTARAFGADVSIRLSFLVGWAQYSTRNPLGRGRNALISVMGSLTQLVAAGLTLAALRWWLLPLSSQADAQLYGDLHGAVMWSGIVIAVLNLLPLFPLDGGNIALAALGSLDGGPTRMRFLQWTLAASGVMAVLGFGNLPLTESLDRWRVEQMVSSYRAPLWEAMASGIGASVAFAVAGSIFIPLICGFAAWQALKSPAARGADVTTVGAPGPGRPAVEAEQAARSAERQGWSTGAPSAFPRGWSASPWLRAHVALRSGGTPAQASAELAALGDTRRRWLLDRGDRPEIGALLAYVPAEVALSPAVVEARKYHGPPQQLVDTALAAFPGAAAPEAYYSIAEGMAQRGLSEEALNWLRGAVDLAPDPERIASSRFLRPLHGIAEFQQLLGQAERAVRR